ncbi:MAG TPA: insulinase family protein [Firmicutes bacterium]|jgi:zinc protease|nr:insulinase family protein [Bacillota bacterium]
MSRIRVVGCLLTVTLLLFSALSLAAPVDPQSPLIPLEMRILENGMRVIVKEIPSYPIATVNVWVNTGAVDDPPGLSGLAHFFEHLTFKGTTTRPRGQIAYEVETLGGYLNAMTSLDYTSYFIVVSSDHVGQAMEIQADALLNSLYEQDEIDMERSVIHEEIRLRIDSPQTHLVDMAMEHLFAGTVYAKNVVGSIEELAGVNRAEVVDFYTQHYVPNNMVLVVTGNVDAEAIFDQADELYGDMAAKTVPSSEHITIPELDTVVYLMEERPLQQSYVFMGHPGPGANTHEAAALTMAGVILGGGRSSRLYKRLIEEEQIVTNVSASYSGFSAIGVFQIYAELDPNQRDRFMEIVREELTRLHKEPVTNAELQRARAMTRSSLAFSTESSTNVAMYLGQTEIYGGVMDAINRGMLLEQISVEDIQRTAQRFLNPNAYIHSEITPVGR